MDEDGEVEDAEEAEESEEGEDDVEEDSEVEDAEEAVVEEEGLQDHPPRVESRKVPWDLLDPCIGGVVIVQFGLAIAVLISWLLSTKKAPEEIVRLA